VSSPEDEIRRYLDENRGSAQVPFRHVLTSWGLTEAGSTERARITRELARVGIRTDPPLSEVRGDDLVTLRAAPEAEQAMPGGWYQNPEGPGQRYWDGARWTDDYAPSPQPPPPQRTPPPQAAPQQARGQKEGSNFLRNCLVVALGIVLGGGLLFVGCAALLGEGFNQAEKEQTKNAITSSQFRSIEQGTTQEEVEAELGEPQDAQDFEQEIPELQQGPQRSSCIYYPEKGKPLFEGRSFQFCFDEGKLTSKNAY
jgi:Protein of unknown function (DUF2510)